MDRKFDFEDAKRLCASHKQILDTIRNTIASRAKDTEKVQKAAKDVFESRVIASQIATALQTGNLNVAMQPNERALIHAVYICDEGEKIVSALRGLADQNINHDLLLLNSVNSSLKWFFSNKQTKEAANEAYDRLSLLLQDKYPTMVKVQADRSAKLDGLSVNEACSAVEGNEQSYLACLNRCVPNLLRQTKLVPEIESKIGQVNETIVQYQTAEKNQKGKEDLARETADKAINPLIMERTLNELRNQDLDVLSQKRSGIRVKALRDHGYRNMADLYTATQFQLASVYGISPDAARVIKYTTNEVAQEVAKTIKLKISSDDRTPAATALLKAAYKYDRVRKAGRVITPAIKTRLADAGRQTSALANLNNNLSWVFAGSVQKKRYIDAYSAIVSGLSSDVISSVQSFRRDVQEDPVVSDTWVWADFEQRSVEYFNLLEDLCPDAFGNDDLLYGLPEDLAREIQDQVYFPQGLKVTLRRYQEWGVKYILHQGKVLLGDEMGLGKTVQAIATMVSLRNTGAKKFLVVCPASVLPNWCKEIDKKSEFRSIMVHGYGRQAAFDSWYAKGGVAVTTYETLSTLKIPAGLEYDLLVVDEAHFIKNESAQRSQYVRLYGTYAKRLLYMTGTALENKVEEMLSLLQTLNPRVASQAQRLAYMSTAPQFRQMIAPVYYRRKREDVLTELPAITYSKEWCDLLPEEYAAYKKAVLAKDRSAIRKVSWVTEDLSKSAKARRMKEIIEEAESDGRKVLVFSFYLETIDRVIQLLGRRCTQPINGAVPVYRRQEIIDEFERMPAGSVLPAQIQAGGTGLNIQSASVVIICEPQLKPSIENQAISRAYRMGQTRKVLVYRLLATDTIDERIDDMLSEKQAIFDAFADISEAVTAKEKEEYQIDDKTFGKLIQEEIDRINAGKGQPGPQQANVHQEPVKPQAAQQQSTRTASAGSTYQTRPQPSAPPVYQEQPRSASQPVNGGQSRKTTSSAYKEQPMVGFSNAYSGTTKRNTSSAYKEEPMVQPPQTGWTIPKTEQSPRRGIVEEKTRTANKPVNFSRIEDFMQFAKDSGVPVKDNREKGGCIWVGSDPRINAMIGDLVFGDRSFRYSANSKTLGGKPGWYY